MLKNLTFTIFMLLPAWLTAEKAFELDTPDKKISYAMGLDLAHSLSQADSNLDLQMLIMGLKDGTAGKPKLSMEEINQIKQDFVKQKQTEREARMKAAGEKNKQEGEAFLKANSLKEDVKTTPSGLQYTVLKQGSGPSPKPTDKVKVHYRGTLVDGTEFDSSYSRNHPIEFPLDGVIAGWTEGLQLMNTGSKYRFFIPPNLAYGEQGAGGKIGPNATLIFDVELLEIK